MRKTFPWIYRLLFSLLALPFVATAQIRCRIDCRLPGAKDSTECKLIVKQLDQATLVNSTLFLDGHAIFVVDIQEPSPAYIWIENRKEDIAIFIDSPTITVSVDSLQSLQPAVSGSFNDNLWNKQSTTLDRLIEKHSELTTELRSDPAEPDSLVFEKAQTRSDSLHSIYEDSLIHLIKEHPQAASSWYLFASNFENFSYTTAVNLFSELTSFNAYASYKRLNAKLLAKRPGPKAPDFSSLTLTGESLTLSRLKGVYVLLDFSASYLYSTRRRVNGLKKLYSKYHAKGLEIVTVCQEFDRQASQETLADLKFPWPVVIDIQGQTSISAKYKIDRVPDNLLLDRSRKIILRDSSLEELESKFKELFR